MKFGVHAIVAFYKLNAVVVIIVFLLIALYRFTTRIHYMINYHIRKIAVATNFSGEASHALQYAVLLAERYDASLDIIHAVSPSDSRNKKAEFVSAAYEKLKQLKLDILKTKSLEIKPYARVGEVETFCYKYCCDFNIDLLVIGVQTGVKKFFAATEAYKIIMKVECPVLSVPASFTREYFRNILFPVRDVAGVEDKVLYTRPFIDGEGTELCIVNFGQIDAAKISEITRIAEGQGVSFRVHDLQEVPRKEVPQRVIATAEENRSDLLVINATSEKEWYDIFGENYTEYILKESEVPVLSITHSFESKS